MPKPEKINVLWKRYEALRTALAGADPILQGSILKRRFKRPLPSLGGKKQSYGPYYQWTQKREGKTVNVNLSRSRAAAISKAIRENQRLERLLVRMRSISLHLLESSTPAVSRRSARRPKTRA